MTDYKQEIKDIFEAYGFRPDFYEVWFKLIRKMPDEELEGVVKMLRDSSRDKLENYTKTLYNKNNAGNRGNIGSWDKIFRSKR